MTGSQDGARRKEIYEELHPETVHGAVGNGREKSRQIGDSTSTDRFTKATLMAIMARMAAYTGKEVTWEEAMNSKEDLFPKDLQWDSKLPVAPVAIPGVNELI